MKPTSEGAQAVPLNIVGGSTFGRYPKISAEKTYNLFESDGWLVPYAGYKNVIGQSVFGAGTTGRGIHTSTKLGQLVIVISQYVYLVDLQFNFQTQNIINSSIKLIGTLNTTTGIVYISENNKPQVAITDGVHIYIYDPNPDPGRPAFYIATKVPDGSGAPIMFEPGYIDFHDTYFVVSAITDAYYTPVATNSWRLSGSNNSAFTDEAANLGLLQTKPDNIQAAVRFPGAGNMLLVMGETVSEPWMDVGYQLFPYQRSGSFNMDYGCINPATIATTDNIVAWLAQNEKSGPVIMFSNGGNPEKITTDGIDYLFSQLQDPSDSRAFIYRQDGHIFYHINFYTDNLSLFYDFNTKRFYHACDENGNYFIADQVAFFNNQYYFISRKNGNLYAFDTIYTTYDGAEVPRYRICAPSRFPSQDRFIIDNVGFTIENGNTPYQIDDIGPIYLETESGNLIITEGDLQYLVSQSGQYFLTQDSNNLITNQLNPEGYAYIILEQDEVIYAVPRIGLSISVDGGESFSSIRTIPLKSLGNRRSKLMWWRLGAANDIVCKFEFWGLGRFVVTNGELNIRE